MPSPDLTAQLLRDPDAFLRVLDKIDSAESMGAFWRACWPVIEPGTPLVWGRVLDALCEHLEAVVRGEIKRLLINIPPGCAKSMSTGVIMPAWAWGPHGWPELRYIGAAHEQGLATRDSRTMRRLVASEWYQERWPVALVGDQNEKTYYENAATGFRQATAVASMTGRRGHIVVWDDPLNPEKANSPVELTKAVRIFRETLPTRLVDPKTSRVIIIMQRLHENDPSGHIIASDYGYEHLCLPMEFEAERRSTTSIGWTDWRKEDGELLFPERFSREVVDRDKTILGSYAAAGQLQQRPVPREGGMFQVGNIPVIQHIPEGAIIEATCRGWDKAGTDGGGAYTAGVRIARLKEGTAPYRYVVTHVARQQLSVGAREALIRTTADADGSETEIVMEQEPGSSGKDIARLSIRNLDGYNAHAVPAAGQGSKETRAQPFAVQCEHGNVAVLDREWTPDYLEELGLFPNGRYKDQVDASAIAFMPLAKSRRPTPTLRALG